jgi:hypothetical protein
VAIDMGAAQQILPLPRLASAALALMRESDAGAARAGASA